MDGLGRRGPDAGVRGSALPVLAIAFIVFAGRTNSRFVLPARKELRSIAIVAVSFAAYIGLLEVVGYLVGTWVLLAIVVRFTSGARNRVAIVWPGVMAVGSYLLFGKALGTHLPTGVSASETIRAWTPSCCSARAWQMQ